MIQIVKKILLAGLMAVMIAGCKVEELETFESLTADGRVVSADGANVAGMTKDDDLVMVPIRVKLSGPAGKAFQIGIEATADTLNKLIANNTLENTVVMPSGGLEYPNVINVTYGTDSATVLVGFKMTGIEQYFPKKVAAAFKLTTAGKGNSIDPAKSTIIAVIDTRNVTKLEDIHYLSVANHGGSVFEIGRGTDYSVTSAGITIPLGVNLGGIAGKPFSVRSFSDVDTISKLMATDPRFSNAILLPEYELDTNINFKSNVNTGNLSLRIPWRVFDANIAANKKLALAVKLRNPSRHVLHPTNNYVILLLDPSINLDNNSFIIGNGTGLKGEYFRGNRDKPKDRASVPDVIRIDPQIDFNWNGDNPFWLYNPDKKANEQTVPWDNDNYSIRWTGEFLAPVRGEYTFDFASWDDGVQFIIDGDKKFNFDNNGNAAEDGQFNDSWDRRERTTKVVLERGRKYKIEIWYRENVGGANCKFRYAVPSADIGSINNPQIVPRSQLFPAP